MYSIHTSSLQLKQLTLVDNLHKETESFRRLQFKLDADAAAEVLSACAGIHFKWHVRVIREVDLVKDLCHLILNCFDFHLVWCVLTTTVPTVRTLSV